MAKTKTSVSDAAKSNGSTKAKAADSPKAKPAASPKAKQAPAASPKASKAKQVEPATKAKPAASPKAPKAVQQNGAVKKQPQQQAKRPAAAKGAKGGQNKNNSKKQQQQQVPKGPFYFETPTLAVIELLLIVGGFLLLAGAVYAPNTIPWFLGPIATIAKELSATHNALLKIVLFSGIGVHFLEGFYAVYLCRQKRINLVPTLKWWIQTTLLGFFSLRLLLKHGSAGGKKKK